ncbi:MAG: nuclear transport factor 2 family protein [Allobranchiibius sp.]|jgi:hypothetical protein
MAADTHPFLDKLQSATNAHDLDAVAGCFGPAYRNQTPAHPSQDFQGAEQVRANWRQIFAFVPDVQATVLGWTAEGPEIWSEWEMSGNRLDGSRHLMRGVIIFGIQHGRAVSARFYLEPVDQTGTTVDAAVRRQVGGEPPT